MSVATDKDGSFPAEEFEEIVEGQASMLYPKNEAVFYNKVQVFNRDTSIQVIRLFAETRRKEHEALIAKKKENRVKKGESTADLDEKVFPGIHILDALAATGLRSVRYLKEIEDVSHVTINDLDPKATAQAKMNLDRNGVDAGRCTIETGDATMLMYRHRDQSKPEEHLYDVIDLDPYGTAVPFLDSAIQSVADGGLLIVTCTDAAVICGSYPEVCFAKYGSVPINNAKYTHEMSLRILLHAIESAASKYKRYIEPWISLSVDFYVRVFVRVHVSPKLVKRSLLRQIYVLQSMQCPSYYIQPMGTCEEKKGNYYPAPITNPTICPHTGGKMKMGGPYWGDPIHKQEIVDEILARVSEDDAHGPLPFPAPATKSRIKSVMTVISEELKDVPLHYSLPDLASTIRITTPRTDQMRAALLNAGYRYSQAHHCETALKTDAPPEVIWDILRCYAKLHPPEGSQNRNPSEVAKQILSVEPTLVADFTETKISLKWKERKEIGSRFPENPEEHWGPKQRAGRLLKEQHKGEEKDTAGFEKSSSDLSETKKPRLE